MMRLFADVLEEYLTERDHQNSDYYDNRYIGSRLEGQYRMRDLADEMNNMIAQVTEK